MTWTEIVANVALTAGVTLALAGAVVAVVARVGSLPAFCGVGVMFSSVTAMAVGAVAAGGWWLALFGSCAAMQAIVAAYLARANRVVRDYEVGRVDL